MNGPEVLRIVDAIHRDKNIAKEIVFDGIEKAILSAVRKHYGEEEELDVQIDRKSGEPTVILNQKPLDADTLGELLGRIAAQTAKQVMIQTIREAECAALFEEFTELKGTMVTGSVSRVEGGAVTVNIGKIEGILPRSEQIPGESHRVGERLRSVILDVRKAGTRVKVILSRNHPDLVRQLFETEIPEVSEGIIEVRSLSREAGYRSKVAVSCIDSKIDAVGACVGVRGSRIKNIVDELAGERIDIVRWNDSLQVLVPNAMQPAEVDDVILCPMMGRVIVLVRDDQLSLAIGKRGQNVRLASKLVGWDIEVMTREELDEQLDKSVEAFSSVPGVASELAENLVAQGFFSYYDLACIEPDQLAELGGLTAQQCEEIVNYADVEATRAEEQEMRQRAELKAAREAGVDLQAEESPSAETASEADSAAEAQADSESEAEPESEPATVEDVEEPEPAVAESGREAHLADVDVDNGQDAESDEAGDTAEVSKTIDWNPESATDASAAQQASAEEAVACDSAVEEEQVTETEEDDASTAEASAVENQPVEDQESPEEQEGPAGDERTVEKSASKTQANL